MGALRIGELLVAEGLVTPSQLQQALVAQQIFGGRLGTNLVENGFVDEADLARVLGRQLGIPVVAPEALADVDRAVIDRVPGELARRYSIVPFRHDRATDRLAIAVADPTNLQKVDEIQFALGHRLDFHISPEIMLAYALEKYYGVERQRRYIRVAGLSDAEMQVVPREGRPAAAAGSRGSAPPGAARAPRTPAEDLLQKIVQAPSKQDLVGIVADGLAARAGQVVFLAVRGGEVIAWETRGLPAAGATARSVSLPLSEAPGLKAALDACSHGVLERVDEALREVLENRLWADASGPIYLLPLIVNRKAFGAYLLAQVDPASMEQQGPALVELMKRVACKLQIFFLEEYLHAPL